MRKVIVAAVGVLALTTGSAYAGCANDNHVAADDSQTPLVASADATDPLLLAKSKEQEDTEALEKWLEISPVPN